MAVNGGVVRQVSALVVGTVVLALTGFMSPALGVPAEEASRDVNGTTLAAHVEHLRWAMQLVNDYYGGKDAPSDWSESWSVSSVDEDAWRTLKEAVRATGDKLLGHLSTPVEWEQEMGRMAMLASYGHTAYHLGAIRQLAKAAKAG